MKANIYDMKPLFLAEIKKEVLDFSEISFFGYAHVEYVSLEKCIFLKFKFKSKKNGNNLSFSLEEINKKNVCAIEGFEKVKKESEWAYESKKAIEKELEKYQEQFLEFFDLLEAVYGENKIVEERKYKVEKIGENQNKVMLEIQGDIGGLICFNSEKTWNLEISKYVSGETKIHISDEWMCFVPSEFIDRIPEIRLKKLLK